MQGRYIKSIVVSVSIPEPTYRQLKKLAAEAGWNATGYVRHLMNQELLRRGLPLYTDGAVWMDL